MKKHYVIFFLLSFVLLVFLFVSLEIQVWAPHIHGFIDNLILTAAFAALMLSWASSYYFFYRHQKIGIESTQNAAKFEEVFENAPVGMTITALNGKFLRINPQLCKMLGYTEEELTQKTFMEITHPDDVEEGKRAIIDLINKKTQIFKQQKRYIHRSGSIVWVSVTATAVFDANDKALYFIVQIDDITENKQIRDALERSEHLYSTVVRQASEGIIIFQDGKLRYVNDYYLKMTGYARAEVTNHSFLEFTPQEYVEDAKARFKNKFGDGTTYQQFFEFGEYPLQKKNGEIIYVIGNASNIEYEDRLATLIFMRDVTKERETKKMKSEFVSIASHQMRTPLTGIRWFSELLLQGRAGKLSKTQSVYIDKVHQSNERMIELIDNLLDVSHLEERKTYALPETPISLKMIIQKAVDTQRQAAKIKDIKLQVRYDGAEDMLVRADEEKMASALENIVNNAVKYSHDGSSVEVGCSRTDGDAVCFVKDQGSGIPLEQQDRVFDKFFRADNVITQTGTGLGLYIAK